MHYLDVRAVWSPGGREYRLESLFWGFSDTIQTKRREVDHEPTYSALWVARVHFLLEISRRASAYHDVPEDLPGEFITLRTPLPYDIQ